jgi:hypothetical protein
MARARSCGCRSAGGSASSRSLDESQRNPGADCSTPRPNNAYCIAKSAPGVGFRSAARQPPRPQEQLPGAAGLLARLGRDCRAALTLSDPDWGTASNVAHAEQDGLPYRFKRRIAKGVKRLV